MRQLPSYADPALLCHVCCLCKTLYGLKQSGHRWYQKLVEILVKNLRFKLYEVDQAIFIKWSKKTLIIIVIHIDDCTIAMSTNCIGYLVLKSHETMRSGQSLSHSNLT